MENKIDYKEKSKQEKYIRDNMDLTIALEELEKIVDLVLKWERLKQPVDKEIRVWEHVVFHQLLSDARKIYASRMEYRTQTEEELKERHKDFTDNVEPFVRYFSKLIYSLIKE